MLDESGGSARVELGEGIQATCALMAQVPVQEQSKHEGKADLLSISSMLQARWKGAAGATTAKVEAIRAGQVCSFRITKLDPDSKTIQLELA